jgi:hypothetical protein
MVKSYQIDALHINFVIYQNKDSIILIRSYEIKNF